MSEGARGAEGARGFHGLSWGRLRGELCGVGCGCGLLKSQLPILCPREGPSRRNTPASLVTEKHGDGDLK